MRILVVDDEPKIAKLIQETLTGKGHQTDLAFDGNKGLELIQANPYDLIFLDFNMPELTGLELIKVIREKKLPVKTVLVTGYEVMESFFAKTLGADEYVRKPFHIAELETILEKYTVPQVTKDEKNGRRVF